MAYKHMLKAKIKYLPNFPTQILVPKNKQMPRKALQNYHKGGKMPWKPIITALIAAITILVEQKNGK